MNSEKVKISGIAIREGVSRNGIKYISEELNKFSTTLKGRPILKDHEGKTDSTIGLVESGESLEGGKIIRYSGWIKEDGTGIVEKIKDGRIKEVSIGAVVGKLIKESEDSEVKVARNMCALELSTTPIPGVQGTSLEIGEKANIREDFSENEVKEWIKNYLAQEEISHSINNQKEVKMEEKAETKAIVTQENAEVKELQAKLANAEKALAEIKEAERQKAISHYTEMAKSKGLPVKDLSNSAMEMISALTETIASIPERKETVEVKPTIKEEKIEVKAEPKSEVREVKSETKAEEILKNYRIESSSLGKYAFYNYY